MNKDKSLKSLRVLLMLLLVGCAQPQHDSEVPLKEVFKEKFLVGAALNADQTNGQQPAELALVKREFNTIVAENCMKMESLQPEQGVFDFKDADNFVRFGEENGMFIVGHTLVWHSQAPDWLFVDEAGNDVSRDTLVARMRNHIHTVVSRYKGRVHAWDVVNEAIGDQETLRRSKWQQIIGDDYIQLAFQFANEADPDAELYYNDYSMLNPHRRESGIQVIQSLKEKGIRIDGIGMQAHYGLDYLDLNEFEESVVKFAEQDVKVMLTELDITVLPFPTKEMSAEISQNYELKATLNPYNETLPDSVGTKLAIAYQGLFEVLLKHQDKIGRVTFWGVNDGQSWRNNWPVKGRKDYPLLFDRDNAPKKAFQSVVSLVKE
ncbi:endo-1,4-beta-xylanase [Limibacter armeniacum]|uniref:endo-1,4-beta-xylanase n=1 Tax=Limibacter armeniacum TaxID=466084 RepID=UPI002FE534CF